jgi:hypothetical protein
MAPEPDDKNKEFAFAVAPLMFAPKVIAEFVVTSVTLAARMTTFPV